MYLLKRTTRKGSTGRDDVPVHERPTPYYQVLW
jgi:hypothetical protein